MNFVARAKSRREIAEDLLGTLDEISGTFNSLQTELAEAELMHVCDALRFAVADLLAPPFSAYHSAIRSNLITQVAYNRARKSRSGVDMVAMGLALSALPTAPAHSPVGERVGKC